MGLDMYLLSVDKKGHDSFFEISPNVQLELGDVGYWRKANQIHSWFVNNVQNGVDDCGLYEVHKDVIIELYDICSRILDETYLAPELLPTQSGFFFGSTDYDDYYLEDIKQTLLILKDVINNFDFDNKFLVYGSSW